MTGQSFVQIAADSTGKKLDTFIVLGSAGSEVHREAFILAFPDANIGSATATSVGGETSLHVRLPYMTSVGGIDGIFSQAGSPFPARVLVVAQGSGGNSTNPWSVIFTNSVGTHPVTIEGQPISVSQSGTWNINTLTAITSSTGVSATVVGQPIEIHTARALSVGEILNAPVALPDGKDTGLSFTQIGAARVYPISSAGRTPEHALISVATSGLTAIVAADTNNKIKVFSYVIVADRRIGIQWRSGSTNLSGVMYVASSGGVSANVSYPAHIMETAVNQALNIQLLNESGAATAASAAGHLSFYREP